MNLANKYTSNEKELLKNVGINIENREYTSEELKQCERQITEYIMKQSTKDGSVLRLLSQYNGILNDLERNE